MFANIAGTLAALHALGHLMRKRNKSWTTGEAVAYDEGYADGYAAGIEAAHIGSTGV